MDRNLLKSIVEGIIFSHPEPVTAQSLSEVIKEVSLATITSMLDELEQEYRERARGFLLCRVAGGYQFRSLPKIAPWILEMKKSKPSRLSRAAMETLAIIAYNQPFTRSEIEQIRGVESSAILRNLVERGLVEVVGKKDVPGRPLLYGTTRRFLEVFGLNDLTSLPPLPTDELVDQALGSSATDRRE
ncbi:MAG: SMC-Scp complex subunit ScpB [Deltaproteobacteria bacterium]|nr:SMC-Scp complex subunit ScpB [Deltaproteobacteria bacterium]